MHFVTHNPVAVVFGSKPKAAKAMPAPTMSPPSHEEPSHAERLHNAAANGHVSATHDYVEGRITKKQYADRTARAKSIMAKTPKNRK